MSNEELKDLYWATVYRCLCELLHVPEAEARATVAEGRKRFDRGQKRRLPMVYHVEEFYTAYDLLNRDMDLVERNRAADEFLDRHREAYQQILATRRSGEVMAEVTPLDAHRPERPRPNPTQAASGKRG